MIFHIRYITERVCLLTPANQSEAPEVLPVWEEGHEYKAVEVQAFHQDPIIISGQEVQEEGHSHLTTDLGERLKVNSARSSPSLFWCMEEIAFLSKEDVTAGAKLAGTKLRIDLCCYAVDSC